MLQKQNNNKSETRKREEEQENDKILHLDTSCFFSSYLPPHPLEVMGIIFLAHFLFDRVPLDTFSLFKNKNHQKTKQKNKKAPEKGIV